MVVVIAGTAIDWRLHSRFACGCGGANEHQYRKSAPEQRQRKENGSVLLRELSSVSGENPKGFGALLWRIFFGCSTPFLLYANKRNGVEKNLHRVPGDAPAAASAEIERQRLNEVVSKSSAA